MGRFLLVGNLLVNDGDAGNRHICLHRMMNKLSIQERKLFYHKIDSESIKFLNFMVGRNFIKWLACLASQKILLRWFKSVVLSKLINESWYYQSVLVKHISSQTTARREDIKYRFMFEIVLALLSIKPTHPNILIFSIFLTIWTENLPLMSPPLNKVDPPQNEIFPLQ